MCTSKKCLENILSINCRTVQNNWKILAWIAEVILYTECMGNFWEIDDRCDFCSFQTFWKKNSFSLSIHWSQYFFMNRNGETSINVGYNRWFMLGTDLHNFHDQSQTGVTGYSVFCYSLHSSSYKQCYQSNYLLPVLLQRFSTNTRKEECSIWSTSENGSDSKCWSTDENTKWRLTRYW